MSTPPFLRLPPGVTRITVPAARGALAALSAGAAGSPREPVLLVPGFTGSKEDFIAILEPVAAAGHPVVAVDQRGQLDTPGDGDPSSYDVKVLAQDVLTAARHLGERVHLVGHSFGGLVARAAALAEPGVLRSLTLMSSGPAAIPHPAASNLTLISQALPVMDLASIWAAKRELEARAGAVAPPPEVEEWLRSRFLASDPVALRRHAEQLLAEEDQVDELAAVGLPTLVLFGDADDAWSPTEQTDMARRLGARVVVVEACGHSPAAERPEATAEALLEFWAGL